MANSESDRKDKENKEKLSVTPLGEDKKSEDKTDAEPQEEFIDPKANDSEKKQKKDT